MANNRDRLTQSPRALRDSTNDPEKYSKGDVQIDMNEPRKSDFGKGQPDPFRHKQDRDGSGWPPATGGG
jgi:hypothetical protein